MQPWRGVPSEGVIVVRMQGGLGNQMFGYAAGRRLALSREAPLVLDTSWKVEKGHAAKPFGLGVFDIRASVRPVWEVARVPNRSRIVRALQRLRPSRRPFVEPLDEDPATNAFVPDVVYIDEESP